MIARDLQEQADTSRADTSQRFSDVEATRLGGEVKLDKAAARHDRYDLSGKPGERNLPLTESSRKDQQTVDADMRTIRAAESTVDEGNIGSASDLAENVRSIAAMEGSTNLTAGEADKFARAGESAVARDIIKEARGVGASKLSGARHRVDRVFDDLTSDMRNMASVDDLTVNLEKASGIVDSAAVKRDEVRSMLAEHGVSDEAEQDRILAEFGVAAGRAAKKLSAIERRPVGQGDVLEDSLKVMAGKSEPNAYADMVFKEFLLNQRVRRDNPGLMKWVEELFSDEVKQAREAA